MNDLAAYNRQTQKELWGDICYRGISPYRWAKEQGVSTGTVYDILGLRPVSAKRLNTVRPLLGLPEIRLETVKIDPARQKIVNRQGPTPYVTRQVRLSKKEAEWVDEYVRMRGYTSFSEWFRLNMLMDILDNV